MQSQKFNVGYQRLPPNLDLVGAIQFVLNNHQGRDNAITRQDLCKTLALTPGLGGGKNFDRVVRASINQMRKDGLPICSTGGKNGGYFMASSADELGEYLEAEVRSRAMDLLEQYRAMMDGARRYFPNESGQLALF